MGNISNDNNIFEVITGKQNLYFDIDMKYKDDTHELVTDFLRFVKDFCIEELCMHVPTPTILTSHSKIKYSLHAMFNVPFKTHLDMKNFLGHMHAYLPKRYTKCES